STMPKRKCHFSDNYTKEWSFIKRGRNEYEAHCTICTIFISVSHSGKTSIHDHNKSNTHKSNISIASSSQDISTFMVKENTPEDILVCAAELTTAYKVVNHHQSFNSLDCNTKLNSKLYPDSKIAAKQSTARTKATAIIKNILAPHSLQTIKEEIEQVPFYGVLTDASNHNAEKLFPLIIQYFSETKGMQLKLIKLNSLENETSETIVKFCINTLNNLNISLHKLIAYSADNTNTNFGGRDRHGTNNVYFKLQSILSKDIEGIGCP
ncbi:protein FAM200B-like, partial [Aphis craccivora]